MSSKQPTKVVQISNIAPQATKDQLQAIFGMLGKIEEIRLYPTIRDVSVTVTQRICYVRFQEHFSVYSAQHLTNSVFIDRALICIPVKGGIIPEEYKAIEMANNGTLVPGFGALIPDMRLPSDVVTKTEGQIPNQVLCTYDPKLDENSLPPYPPLPVNFDQRKLWETRRTILVLGVKSDWSASDIIEFFDERAGDVKYFRFALMDKDKKIAMIEFDRQEDIIAALKLQGTKFNGVVLNLTHSTQPIEKPEAKTNEAAQKDIEDAMNAVVKDTHSSVTVMTEPAFTLLASKDKGSTSRRHSRTRSPSLEVRSSYSRSKRSRSRKRERRSKSRSHRKRSTSRRRSRSRSNKRRKRSTSRRRTRTPSRTRRHRRRERSRSRHKSSRNRSRSRDRRSKSRDRSRSRHRSEKKKKSHREKKEIKYSVSRSRSKSPVRKISREPSREKASAGSSKRRSPDRKLKKISEEHTRDYDAEEKIGMDDNGCEKSSSKSDNMDISP